MLNLISLHMLKGILLFRQTQNHKNLNVDLIATQIDCYEAS